MRAAEAGDAGVAPEAFDCAVGGAIVGVEETLMSELVRERDLRRRFIGQRLGHGGELGAVVAVALGPRRDLPDAADALLARIGAGVVRVSQPIVIDGRKESKAVDALAMAGQIRRDRLSD